MVTSLVKKSTMSFCDCLVLDLFLMKRIEIWSFAFVVVYVYIQEMLLAMNLDVKSILQTK